MGGLSHHAQHSFWALVVKAKKTKRSSHKAGAHDPACYLQAKGFGHLPRIVETQVAFPPLISLEKTLTTRL